MFPKPLCNTPNQGSISVESFLIKILLTEKRPKSRFSVFFFFCFFFVFFFLLLFFSSPYDGYVKVLTQSVDLHFIFKFRRGYFQGKSLCFGRSTDDDLVSSRYILLVMM